jgi:hypothetical protein
VLATEKGNQAAYGVGHMQERELIRRSGMATALYYLGHSFTRRVFHNTNSMGHM